MRHGESANNTLNKSLGHETEAYEAQRSLDPRLTEKGEEGSFEVGCKLKEIAQIDEIRSSPFFRALQTADAVRRGLGKEDLTIKVAIPFHEHKGVYLGEKTFPGMGRKEMTESITNIDAQGVGEEGWYRVREVPETYDQLYSRAKNIVKALKEESKAMDGKTVLIVTHGNLLNAIYACITDKRQQLQPQNRLQIDNNALVCLNISQQLDDKRNYVALEVLAYNLKLL